MKALPISVYRTARLGDCSNGGISSKYDTLLLIHDEGFINVDPENPPENAVKLVTRFLFGREYKHIEPLASPQHLGWMAGGNIAHTSDSRFPSDYPLTIHDRQETQEQYDLSFN